MPTILDADAAIPAGPGGLSVMSYNVLMPNGDSAWWVYKFYDPESPAEIRAWEHRRGLLEAQILGAAADCVCLQETLAPSFEGDVAGLTGAGYAALIHKKGFLRPATLWRRDRLALEDAWHDDRALITALRPLDAPERRIFVANLHLSATAGAGRRRFGQVFGALERIRKATKRAGIAPEAALVVLAGDFNGDPARTAVEALLRGQPVGPDFREPGAPDAPLTSKPKAQPFGAFADAYADAYADAGLPAPPTMWLPRLAPAFLQDGALSPALRASLTAIFEGLAGPDGLMDRGGVARWIALINGAPDRGSELRAAEALLEDGRPGLSLEDWLGVYAGTLAEGKYWSVLHDLHACGRPWAAPLGAPWTSRFDQIRCSGALRVEAARAPLSAAQEAQILAGEALPNAWHPSDHLPIVARLSWA